MYQHQYLKVGIAVPQVKLGNTMANAKAMIDIANTHLEAAIILYPELAITGYSLGDWFFNETLIQSHQSALQYLLDESTDQVWIIGGILQYMGSLFNVAYIVQNHQILGIVPKVHLPRTREFTEPRIFASGMRFMDKGIIIECLGQKVLLGSSLFHCANHNITFGVEICGDIWAPSSPHASLYVRGADIVFNPSASTYYVGKNKKRVMLCQNASYVGEGAYIYTSTGMSETASDVVFSGHQIACELGKVLVNQEEFEFVNRCTLVDIDIETIHFVKRSSGWLHDYAVLREQTLAFSVHLTKEYRLETLPETLPFVPKTDEAYESIIDATIAALYHRLKYIGIEKAVLGVSGGLDSTLALLMIVECFKRYQISAQNILAVTMPGLGTGTQSKSNAQQLMTLLNVTEREIPITEAVLHHFELIGHDKAKKNTTYENVQARYRTMILMNLANKEGGIVIGTSDMSEIALGWSTFAGDQIAMYNLNAGLPKTVVKALVNYFAKKYPNYQNVLNQITNALISPELTGDDQATEEKLGKYEINDFIMYQLFMQGASKERLLYLLQSGFSISATEADRYYFNFLNRFNHNQYKRIASAEGIKIFELSLSPRSDLRYPGDME